MKELNLFIRNGKETEVGENASYGIQNSECLS